MRQVSHGQAGMFQAGEVVLPQVLLVERGAEVRQFGKVLGGQVGGPPPGAGDAQHDPRQRFEVDRGQNGFGD